MEQSFPKRPFRTHGGAHVPHHKNTAHTETRVMPPPDEITLPMTQHIGAPCVPCVKKGDHVYVGTKVADSDAYVSVPIHSSVSGTVKEIKKVIMPGGQAVDAVIITSDGLMEHDPAVCPRRRSKRSSSWPMRRALRVSSVSAAQAFRRT